MAIERPPRTEIWVRKFYLDDVRNRTLTTIFRPGRRLLSEGHPKALGLSEIVRVRVVDKVGADWAGIWGELLPQPNFPARIVAVTLKRLGDIDNKDFLGLPSDIGDRETLRASLRDIYNFSRDEVSDRLWVTRTEFRYIEEPAIIRILTTDSPARESASTSRIPSLAF